MALMMSVSGIRGLIGESLTPTLAAEAASAFGSQLSGRAVVLGRDSRPSGEMIANAVKSGLMAVGCDVVDLGVVTTPATALMVLETKSAGGIVITASHNPLPWNGIKFLTEGAIAPSPEAVEQIFARIREKRFDLVKVDALGGSHCNATSTTTHVAKVLKIVDANAIRRRHFKVVLDSVNGAGGAEGRLLLTELGCEIVQINGEPTGLFAHTPEPLAENLTGLCDEVRTRGADIGFAQDPDADRLAIVDSNGRYIGEEYTIVLAAKYALRHRPGSAAVNLSTSRMIDDVAEGMGAAVVVHRTAVGEAHVARAILEKKCVIGGEGNGGVIDPRVVPVRDSLVGMALTLGLLAEESRPLSAVVDDLPRYVMIKQKFEMEGPSVTAWLGRVRACAAGARVNDSDGIRIDWPEGWVHVRPSNTEPIARVIAEAKDIATATMLAKRVSDLR